jgi:flagellar motor protein MotB
MIPFLHRAARVQAEENPLWLVVLCDLMTNLMLFFLVMYSFTLQNPKTRAEWLRAFEASQLIDTQQAKADAVVQDFKEKQAAAALIGLINSSDLRKSADIDVTERVIRVRLKDQLLFATAQAGLNPQADATLSLLSGILKQIPNDILVEGHTDDVRITAGPYARGTAPRAVDRRRVRPLPPDRRRRRRAFSQPPRRDRHSARRPGSRR